MRSAKKTIMLLITVFVAPILLGTLLFFNMERLGYEKGSTNYGTLVQPARPSITTGLYQSGQEAKKEETLTKRWTLVYTNTDACTESCKDKLTLIKKVRLLTNEKMRRVRTLFVTNAEIAKQFDTKNYADLVITHINDIGSPFVKQFPAMDKKPIYLVDPLGNIMMYYPQIELNAKKMIKDLNRLLKYSALG